MVLLIQCALGGVLLLSTFVVVGLLHGSLLMAGIVGFVLIGILWFVYLVWQGNHPDWWAPWDEGLPQTTRMSNAFIPVLILFVFVLFLAPVFIKAREKGLARRQRDLQNTAIQKQRQNETPIEDRR
jgi:hypothetical protein